VATLLEVRGLCKNFGAVIAAKDINADIHAAEVVGVIGSNGAGKTAFINMVTGYLKPTAGTIRFQGRDITGLPPRAITRAGVGRSFQIAQLFPGLTVLDNMLNALGMLREGRLSWLAPMHTAAREKDALEVLARYAIDKHAPDPVSTLSQGVRKLLDIAMSTVSTPPLVLLDEPTSGVAIDDKFALMDNVMGAVRASGAGCLFVEHDMEIVGRYAKRVMAFYEGRILADGPTQQVLDNPEVRQFVIGSEIHRKNQD
jgi:branched-chain amino acid transport system ATP-binding protein